jgi:hypothetical protein
MTGTGAAAGSPPWPIVITEWALDSYLNMKHRSVFTDVEYKGTIRPDVLSLRQGIPSPDAKFANPKFWGPAKLGNKILHPGYKMKWHQMGPGLVQIRLPVMVGRGRTFLCAAYVKQNPSQEKRMLARFKTHMNDISQGRFTYRGTL